MIITTILQLIWLHFIADFIFQNDKMAMNKSKNSLWLLYHVIVYGAFFLPFGVKFALVNVVLHFITDFISSRITSALWQKQKRHEFFVVIGADQALHLTALILTYDWWCQ